LITPLLAVLCVVKVAPQEQVTCVSTYCGWMSGFMGSSSGRWSPGRQLA
jgi:hypothetical protein